MSLLLYPFLVLGDNYIDYSRPPEPDWPDLRIIYHETTAPCAKGDFACAGPNFTKGVCDVYLPSHPPRETIIHEKAHCLGYDHHDDSLMHDAWRRYKRE